MKRKDHEFFGGYQLGRNYDRIEWFIPTAFNLDRERELSMANEGGVSAAVIEGPEYHGKMPIELGALITTEIQKSDAYKNTIFIKKPAMWITSTLLAAGVGYYFYKYHKAEVW